MNLSGTHQNKPKQGLFERFWNTAIWNTEQRGSVHSFGTGRSGLQQLLNFLGSSGKDEDSGQNVDSETGARLAIVHNCLNVLAQDLASQNIQIRQNTDNEGVKKLYNQLHKLLNTQPNKWENGYQFKYGMIYMGEGWGNSYAYIKERDANGYPTELIRLKPWEVSAEIVDGELYYIVSGTIAIHSSDMFHYRSMVTDGPMGENKIVWNKKTIGKKLKESKYTSTSIGNKPP